MTIADLTKLAERIASSLSSVRSRTGAYVIITYNQANTEEMVYLPSTDLRVTIGVLRTFIQRADL